MVGAWFFLRTGWPEERLSTNSRVLLFCLAAGVGLGLSSCCFFLWYPLLGHPGAGFIAFEVMLVVLLAALLTVARRCWPAGQARPDVVRPTSTPPRWARWLWVPFAASALLAARY